MRSAPSATASTAPAADRKPEIVAASTTTTRVREHRNHRCAEQSSRTGPSTASGSTSTPAPTMPTRPRRDSKGRRLWVAEAWQWILDEPTAATRPSPPGPAATPLPVHRLQPDRPGMVPRSRHRPPRPEDPARQLRPDRPPSHNRHGPAPDRPLRNQPRPLARTRLVRPPHRPTRPGDPIDPDDPEARAHRLASAAVPIATLAEVLTRYRRRARTQITGTRRRPSVAKPAASSGADRSRAARSRPT